MYCAQCGKPKLFVRGSICKLCKYGFPKQQARKKLPPKICVDCGGPRSPQSVERCKGCHAKRAAERAMREQERRAAVQAKREERAKRKAEMSVDVKKVAELLPSFKEQVSVPEIVEQEAAPVIIKPRPVRRERQAEFDDSPTSGFTSVLARMGFLRRVG